MDTLQMNAAKALAKGWLKKQKAFLETVPVALRDEVRRQLGCISDQSMVDDVSKQLLAGTFKAGWEESMMTQMFDDFDVIEYDDSTHAAALLQLPRVNRDVANFLGVTRRQFSTASISFKESTVILTRVIDGENIVQFQEELLAVGMPEAELAEALQNAEKADNNPDIEMFNITYTIPLLIALGTRYSAEYDVV
jgi:hypothetical protein